jgi:GT2 family glycosyltransferase
MNLSSKSRLKLSIVIAASNNISLLEECLKSLQNQTTAEDTEIIVVSNYIDGLVEKVKSQYTDVKFVSLSAGTTIPMLRTAGIRYSRGEIVALLEDNVILDKNWCAEIKKAHELPYAIIGGSVENANGKKKLDWAVYFYEYGKYMQPNQTGVVDSLAGNNITYKRKVLKNLNNKIFEGFFETFINWELMKSGESLYMVPSAIAYHTKSYDLKKVIPQCYHHGRSFAGMRIYNATLFKRVLFILGSMTLPILLPWRITLIIFRKGRHFRELLLSLPYLILLMSSWGIGEFCGYLFGEGASTAKWK